jgi:aminopeptidase
MYQVEEMRPGAKTAVVTCMGVKPADRVYVLTDRMSHDIGRLIAEEAAALGVQVEVHDLEEFGPRPMTEMTEPMQGSVLAFRPTVTFLAAASQPGEVPMRMAFRALVLGQLNVRHGHMPGITPRLMIEGMGTDYRQVAAVTWAVYELGRKARHIHVTTPDGTDLHVDISPNLRWVPSTGIYHEQGQWGNLPEGETFTCPADANGRLVAHILGDYFSEKYGVLDSPVTFVLENGRVTQVEGENQTLVEELIAYLDAGENGRRAGEFAIGTNVGLTGLCGNLLQDEKYPGIHVAFGNPYPGETGADWTAKNHIDVIPLNCTIVVDGVTIMADGGFDYDLLGVPAPGAPNHP